MGRRLIPKAVVMAARVARQQHELAAAHDRFRRQVEECARDLREADAAIAQRQAARAAMRAAALGRGVRQ